LNDVTSQLEETTQKIDAILKIQDFILNELPALKNIPENVKGIFNSSFNQQSANPKDNSQNSMIQQALGQMVGSLPSNGSAPQGNQAAKFSSMNQIAQLAQNLMQN